MLYQKNTKVKSKFSYFSGTHCIQLEIQHDLYIIKWHISEYSCARFFCQCLKFCNENDCEDLKLNL